jgi:hypothetical protein
MKKQKPWKADDWAVFDLRIVQIRKLTPYIEVSDGSFTTSGNLVDRLRPLTLRNKATIEWFDWHYRELRKIRGERGFNYPDISRYFANLSLDAMDGAEDDKTAFDAASNFVREAQDHKPVIGGVQLFRAA